MLLPGYEKIEQAIQELNLQTLIIPNLFMPVKLKDIGYTSQRTTPANSSRLPVADLPNLEGNLQAAFAAMSFQNHRRRVSIGDGSTGRPLIRSPIRIANEHLQENVPSLEEMPNTSSAGKHSSEDLEEPGEADAEPAGQARSTFLVRVIKPMTG